MSFIPDEHGVPVVGILEAFLDTSHAVDAARGRGVDLPDA
jgi:hypothetical protein